METFIFRGTPVAWKRPGKPQNGRGTYSIDLQKVEKDRVGYEALSQLKNGRYSKGVPLFTKWTFIFPKQPKAIQYQVPDVSNLIKFYEDALNRVIWWDDRQICLVQARKLFGPTPSTILGVITLEDS